MFNGIEEIEIECGSGDSIAIATLFKCPIYTTSDILDVAGVIINDDGTQPEDIEEDDDEFDDEFDEIIIDKGACVEFYNIENGWYILSSDGLKLK